MRIVFQQIVCIHISPNDKVAALEAVVEHLTIDYVDAAVGRHAAHLLHDVYSTGVLKMHGLAKKLKKP